MLEYTAGLKAVISISPLSYTEKIASQLDKERQEGSVRRSLAGIPLLIQRQEYATSAEDFRCSAKDGGGSVQVLSSAPEF